MMDTSKIPAPAVMPVDRDAWAKELNLSNFINTYYQFRDLQSLDHVRRVLIIGPGQGLDTIVLRWRGYEVTTLDIDNTFKPDVIGSVHDLSMFDDGHFDAVTASHVIEHQAVAYLNHSLAEIARVGRYALVYLPVAGRHAQLRFTPGVLGIDFSLVVDLFNYFHRPDGITPRYCLRQHFWEIGWRGWRTKDVLQRLERYFVVLKNYRNRDWTPSHNFVLRSRRTAA